jgi:uncharacterized protein YraI
MKQAERKPRFLVGLRERIQESAMTARLKTALLAASFLGLLTGVAAVEPATVVTTSNLRAGPGTEYPVQAIIPGGATIDVQGCDGSWCVARYAGYEGYISQSVVAAGGAPGPAVAVAPDDHYYDGYGPDYGYAPSYDYYGPSYGYGYQRGHRRTERQIWQDSRRGNGQVNRGNWQVNRSVNWQRNSGQASGAGVQQRSQQNFRATMPRVQSQPTAGGRGAGGGRAATQGPAGQIHQ